MKQRTVGNAALSVPKKLLSIILSLCMLFSITAGIDFSAQAATNGHSQSDAINYLNSKIGIQIGDGQCPALAKDYYSYLGYSVSGNGKDYEYNVPNGWVRTYYYSGYVPQPGDVAVWHATNIELGKIYGHVAIVKSATASSMTCYEQGNSAGKKVRTNGYSYGSVTCFIRPDFSSGFTSLPSEQWIWSDKTTVAVGEQISFNFNAKNATWYEVGIWHDGNHTIIDNGSSDWCVTAFYEPGIYYVHAAIHNNYGFVDTSDIIVNVYNKVPESPWISSDKTYVQIGEQISFNFNAKNATWYEVGIWHDENHTIIDNGSSDCYTTAFSKPGTYHVHAAIHNNFGFVDTSDIVVVVYKKLTITFNSNGGSCSTASKTVNSDKTYGTLPTPTRTGYVFDGWYSSSTGGTKVTSSSKLISSSNHTLYAHWKLCNHIYTSEVISKPTCTKKGSTKYTCKTCGYTNTEETALINHQYTVSGYTIQTCTEEGTKIYTCTSCGATKSEAIPATGHTAVTDKAVKATYAKAGKTEGSHCSTCGEVLVAQKKVAKLTVPKITLSSVKSKKSKQITVAWVKNTKVTGYQIQYATNSGFTKNKKTVTVSKNSATSKTITKLKGKTKYYVRIRAYKVENGKKYYSSWSTAKSVTTKK